MARHIEAADLPEDIARTAEAQVAAGRFASVEDVVRPGSKRSQPSSKSASLCAPRCKVASRAGIFEGDAFASVRAELGLTRQ